MLSKISSMLKGTLVFGLGLVALALMPPAYIEIGCRSDLESQSKPRFIGDEWARAEKDAILSIPRHHMAFTYAEMAQTLDGGAVHDFGFIEGVKGYWTLLCAVMPVADNVGETSKRERLSLYGTGVVFSADLAMKALYEETLGRVVDMISRDEVTPTERVERSGYIALSEHLHDRPWWEFKWDGHVDALTGAERLDVLRDHERLGALWTEWQVKDLLSEMISIPPSIPPERTAVHVSWVEKKELSSVEGLRVEGASGRGYVVSFPRGGAVTEGVLSLIEQGGLVSEISGADDVLVTVLSDAKPVVPSGAEVIAHIKRPGFEEDRFVLRARVRSLSNLIDTLRSGGDQVERILDH